MRVVTKQERGEAIQVRGVDGTTLASLNGHWLVNIEGRAITEILTDEAYRARFVSDDPEVTEPRGRNGRELLTVPPAHAPLNPKAGTISDRILSTVGTKPMAAKDIVAAVGGNPSNTRSALARMAKAGALKSAGRGLYVLGRVAR